MGDTNDKKVGHLKKVTLDIVMDGRQMSSGVTKCADQFTFIFGVGREGMSPFEYALIDKHVGDTIEFSVEEGKVRHVFEHLALPFNNSEYFAKPFCVSARVVDIGPATDREIVKALALAGESGDSCGCGGCGCS